MKRALLLPVLLIATPVAANSGVPPHKLANVQLADPAKEGQAKALMEKLRCLVCQGQSIADSDADMAADMRGLVRERIANGETPDQVHQWLVQRYGEAVTYDPPFGWATAPLWIAPILLLVLGLLLTRGVFKRSKQ